MRVTRDELRQAAAQVRIDAAQAELLWKELEARQSHRPRFTLGHVLYYLGGLVIISSMSWFMVTAWERFGGGGILLLSLAYMALLDLAGLALWRKPGLRIPGGILFAAAVSITPLAVYGLQRMLNGWPQGGPANYAQYHQLVKSDWIAMELATVAVGCVTLRFFRFPFITFPIAFALWYLSMDLTPLLFGKADWSWEERKAVSLVFGAVLLTVTYFIDRRTREDFAFWGYLFGLLAFWGGLSSMDSNSELGKAIYCLVNLGLIFLSVFLGRRAFIVFGALGVLGYVGHLAEVVFKDSLLFPFALSLLGIAIIWVGVRYQKNREKLEAWILRSLPESMRALRPQER